MKPTDIIALVALCLSAPAFVISFSQIIFYFFKKNLKISIIGSGINCIPGYPETTIFYLQISNRHKDPISITKITINDNNVFVIKKRETYDFRTVNLLGFQSITLKLDSCYSNIFDKIQIKCYTTRRLLPYRKNYKSFISWSKKDCKISAKDRRKIKKRRKQQKRSTNGKTDI